MINRSLYLLVIILFLLVPAISLKAQPGLNPTGTVQKIFKQVPSDLNSEVLLVARYEKVGMPKGPLSKADQVRYRKQMERVNKAVEDGNQILDELLRNYPYPYKMVTASEIYSIDVTSYKYYLDLVWMPKQFTDVRREALVPSYEKFGSANKMFTNDYLQFHYYFYIRDLQEHNAFLTTRIKGNGDPYKGLANFIDQVKEDHKGKRFASDN